MMAPLLEDWDRIAERVRRAPAIALFLDFDGTLAPLTDDPKGATMNRAARAALKRLARAPQIHAWIISGRRRDDLESAAGPIPGLTFLGLHGVSSALLTKKVRKTVAEARETLASRLNGTKGVMIEDKVGTFAVHHRNATEPEAGRARRLLDQVIAEQRGSLRIIPGDRVWEVLPREVRGKGDAVRREWRRRSPDALPIYIGNDGTDESAFAALAAGITARVGPAKPTRAHYSLRDCAEVARVLELLDEVR
jgi:trehalose-phosphatase